MSKHLSIHQSDDPYASAVKVAAVTNIGMRRRTNQDSYVAVMSDALTGWQRNGHLLIVADGMGAHAAGEKASRMATEGIPHHYGKLVDGLPVERLHRAMIETNSEIYRRGQANIEFRNMGTTVSVLLMLPEGAVCGHVGDSRIYRLRDSHLEQLTFDHSLVWEMQAAGEINDEALKASVIPKNVITRSLGPNASVVVDLEGPFPLKVGDKFLLCSDGLTGQVADEELGVIMSLLPPEQSSQALVDLANLRGGPDNITVVVAEIGSDLVASNPSQIASEIRHREPPKFSLPFLITCIICALAASCLLYLNQIPLAVVTTVLSALALLAGVVQLFNRKSSQRTFPDRYGKAPHRRWKCRADQGMAERLSGTLQGLREAATENHWNIDWKILDDPMSEANIAFNKKDYASAVRLYALKISEAVQQIPRLKSLDGDGQ